MNKLPLVIQREFLTRIRKRSFWVMTFALPLLMIGIALLPILLSQIGEDKQHVAILDHTGRYAELFHDSEGYSFVRSTAPLDSLKSQGIQEEITAVLEIRDDLSKDPSAVSLFSFKQLPKGLEAHINDVLSRYLTEEKIRSYDIPQLQEAIQKSQVQLRVPTYKWDEDGDLDTSSSEIASGIGMLLTFLSYMFILTYGGMVLQGVQEEKKNRIVEVIVSSVHPRDLMMGKIVGIGLAGLIQITIWFVLIFSGVQIAESFFLSEGAGAQLVGGPMGDLSMVQLIFSTLRGVDVIEILVFFVLFFIGGYFFFASILSAMGAMASSDEEIQQMMLPLVLLLVVAMYAGIGSASNPDGTLAFWASIIPLTSPVVMMVRLPFDVPLWQELLSLVILYLSAFAISALAGKIYRTGILMYGKKPSLKELWRWLSYK